MSEVSRNGGSSRTRASLLAAAPQLLDHPVDVIVRDLPRGFFLAGAYFALRAFERGVP